MIDKEPRYSQYSLDELKCALSSLDEERFPERSTQLRSLISEQPRILNNERESQIAKARDFLEKDLDGENTLLITNSSSGSKTALLVANIFVTLLLIFGFLNEPEWLSGVILVVMLVAVIWLFEHVTGQLKVSFDREYLNITHLGLKFLRRNKKIPLSNITRILQETKTTSARGFPVNTYLLQAQLNNGNVQHLTVLKTEQEGLLIAEKINRVISRD
jgi:hypothetical protein